MTKWTKEPPKEPGWYWMHNHRGMTIARVGIRKGVYCFKAHGGMWGPLEKRRQTWWFPIPITPPSEEKP